jgi:gamma-glutamyltranspeptidase/glutathione hydrolase
MRKSLLFLFCLALLGMLTVPVMSVLAQSPVQYCNASPKPPWCNAVRGDRVSSGWLPQGRSEVMARNGIVATSQPLAAQAGLRILMAGGNAVDAAVATAAVLNLVEPMNVGIGGDLFAIIYIAKDKKLYQLNAGGMAPTGATVDYYKSLGRVYDPNNWGFGSGMSSNGILAAPVPSAAWGWDDAVRRFGKLSLKEVMQPAIEYAEKGFPISEVIGSGASGWSLPNAVNSSGGIPCSPVKGACDAPDPDSVDAWYINGQKPKAGQIFKNPDLARTFRLFAEQGRDVFYKGEIAHAIVKKSKELGGTMTLEDLRKYYGEWVEAPHTNYHGYEIYEAMAPSQAWNVLEMMNILEVCVPKWIGPKTLADLGPANPQYWHLIVEAKKLSFIDLYDYNSDPRTWSASQQQLFKKLISKEYAATLCGKVNPNGPAFTPGPTYNTDPSGDTIYLTTADRWGNMVSWVNSNYTGFGTGITIPGYGFVLNSRLAQFTLDPNHPNRIEPHKRPYDTISCGFVMKDGQPLMTLGLMGGDMQVQGHGQMLVNILDLGANLQASTDMARFYHNEVPNTLGLETQLYNLVGATLKSTYGHNVSLVTGSSVGGYQAIMYVPDLEESDSAYSGHHKWYWPTWGHEGEGIPGADVKPINGFYRAGSDHRKDGGAVGW